MHYKITEKIALNDLHFNTFHVVLPLITTTSVVTPNPNPNQTVPNQNPGLNLNLTLILTCQIWYGGKNIRRTKSDKLFVPFKSSMNTEKQ